MYEITPDENASIVPLRYLLETDFVVSAKGHNIPITLFVLFILHTRHVIAAVPVGRS